jgi:hypothetical protein
MDLCIVRIVYIYIYVQQDAKLHRLFYLETAIHLLVGTSTHHQQHKQLYLQHLVFYTVTATCRYSCRQLQTYLKPEAVITVFELLMMSNVSLETW